MALRGHSALLFLFLVCLKPLRGHLFLLFNFGLAVFCKCGAAQPALCIVRFGLRGVGCAAVRCGCAVWVCGVGVRWGGEAWVCEVQGSRVSPIQLGK